MEDHGPAVLRLCVARVGRERAEDAFQETMLAALRAYTDLRDAGAVRSWLLAIAVRTTVDDLEAVAGAAEPAPRDDALWGLVRALPDKQREAVTLRYMADLSHREVAEVMGTSEEAARRNVLEGLRRLRRDA